MNEVFINSLGVFLPGAPIGNLEMEAILGKIGGKLSRFRSLVLRQNRIKTRHYALNERGDILYTSAEMAANAIGEALKKSEANAGDITYLAASSTLGDLLVPGLASNIHAELQWKPLEIANFQSVCASSLMAVKSAYLQLKSGEHKLAAVSGSEFASRYFRPSFYESTDYFKQHGEIDLSQDFLRFTLSDGAGAAVLETQPNNRGLSLKIHWIEIRSFADRFATCMVGGGAVKDDKLIGWSMFGSPDEAVKAGAFALSQDFELMRKMIPVWISQYLDLVDKGKVVVDEVDHVVCHYSSQGLRDETIALLKTTGALIAEEKWFSNLSTKGNTGTASIFILLEELFYSGKLKLGEKILCQVPESGRALNGFMLLEVV